MGDKTLNCKDCGAEFIFSEGEQAFYKEKGLKTNPKDALIAEKQEKSRKEATAAAGSTPATGLQTEITNTTQGTVLIHPIQPV